MADLNSLVETLSDLTPQESGQLAQIVRERWGIQEDQLIETVPIDELLKETTKIEQTEFSLTLTSFGDKKLEVIKVVRALLNIPLKDAKDLVESAPKLLKDDLTKSDSEEWQKKIEEVGGKVELR